MMYTTRMPDYEQPDTADRGHPTPTGFNRTGSSCRHFVFGASSSHAWSPIAWNAGVRKNGAERVRTIDGWPAGPLSA